MPAKTYGKITGFCGPKGSGKTFAANKFTSSARRIIAFDLNYQAELAKASTVASSRAELIAALKAGDRVVYRGNDFDFANRAAIAYGKCVAFWDEAETWAKRSDLPESAESIIRRGRHVGVDLVWTAQRPTNIHPDVRQNSDVIYLFAGHDPTYYKFVEQVAGKDGLEMLKALDHYENLVCRAGKPPVIGKKF